MQGVGYDGRRSLPEQVLEESTVQPEDVRLQQKADGTFHQLGSGSFGKVVFQIPALMWSIRLLI